MMRFIDSDDTLVADLLASTLELVAESGGWVAPGTRFISREGQLSVQSDAGSESPLFHIPQTAFVRVDEVIWGEGDERLEILSVPDYFGDIELEMLYLQVALHNQCGKLPWLAKTHPWLAPEIPADVINAVRQVVPAFRQTPMSARDALWANRCFKISIDSNPDTQRLLIPLVDLLDHHSQGSTGSWTGSAFEVTAVHPFETTECFLNYGMGRDALEMAAVYGFVDLTSTIANSAPIDFVVPEVGLVRVLDNGRDAAGINLPLVVDTSSGLTTLSHWVFLLQNSTDSHQALTGNSGLEPAQAISVIEILREANIGLLQDIMNACARYETSQPLQILWEAARKNLAILTK